MATKKKGATATAEPTPAPPAEAPKAPRVKADGTPWAPKRSNEEMLADYEKRRADYIARSQKVIANFDAKIAYFKGLGPSNKEAAASELLAGGMSPEEIVALEAKLRAAKEFIKGKSPEELAALKQKAQAGQEGASAPAEVPAFLAPPAQGSSAPQGEPEDEEEDEEEGEEE